MHGELARDGEVNRHYSGEPGHALTENTWFSFDGEFLAPVQGRDQDNFLDSFDPEDRSHLGGLSIGRGGCGLAEQKSDVVGSAAEKADWGRGRGGNEHCGGADDVLGADVRAQQRVWIVQHRLSDGSAGDKRPQILRDPQSVGVGSGLAGKLEGDAGRVNDWSDVHRGYDRRPGLCGIDETLSINGGSVGNRGHARDGFPERWDGGGGDMNPDAGFEVDADFFAVDGDVADALDVGHAVEEGVFLGSGAAIGDRTQALGKSESLSGEVEFEDIVVRWSGGNRIGKRCGTGGAVRSKDRVKAVASEFPDKGGEWSQGRRWYGSWNQLMVRSKLTEQEVIG